MEMQEQMRQALERYKSEALQEMVFKGEDGRIAGVLYNTTSEVIETKAVGDGKELVVVRATTGRLDRTNDRLKVAGGRLDNYRRNPVILWEHNRSYGSHKLPPIGRAEEIRAVPEMDAIELGVLFQNITQLGKEVGGLVKAGFINTVSVGFLPLKWTDTPITEEERAAGGYYPFTHSSRSYEEWELTETSFCCIPMNPSAEVIRRSLGEDYDEVIRKSVELGLLTADGAIATLIGGKIDAGTTSGATTTTTDGRPSTEKTMNEEMTKSYEELTECLKGLGVEGFDVEKAGAKFNKQNRGLITMMQGILGRLLEQMPPAEEGSDDNKKSIEDTVRDVLREEFGGELKSLFAKIEELASKAGVEATALAKSGAEAGEAFGEPEGAGEPEVKSISFDLFAQAYTSR